MSWRAETNNERLFSQCRLRKDVAEGKWRVYVAYLPYEVAKKAHAEGLCVRFLDDEEGCWNEGWKVVSYSDPVSERSARNDSRQWECVRRVGEGVRNPIPWSEWGGDPDDVDIIV